VQRFAMGVESLVIGALPQTVLLRRCKSEGWHFMSQKFADLSEDRLSEDRPAEEDSGDEPEMATTFDAYEPRMGSVGEDLVDDGGSVPAAPELNWHRTYDPFESNQPCSIPAALDLNRHTTFDPFESNDPYLWPGGVWPMMMQLPCPSMQHFQESRPASAAEGGVVVGEALADAGHGQSLLVQPEPESSRAADDWNASPIIGEPPSDLAIPGSISDQGHIRARCPPRSQSIEVEKDATTNIFRIWWTADARKLSSSDKEGASGAFNLGLSSGPAQFKMIIRASVVSTERRGSCFKKAKGKGCVEVRCLEQMDSSLPLRFRLAVGKLRVWGEEARGPVEHNFADRALYSLPERVREWDFSQHVDKPSQTFDVCLEILGGASDAWLPSS